MPLEVVECLVPGRAHDVGHVRLGMDVADLRAGVVRHDLVPDGLDQACLAEADASVDEQRVVRGRVVGHRRCGAGELVARRLLNESNVHAAPARPARACAAG